MQHPVAQASPVVSSVFTQPQTKRLRQTKTCHTDCSALSIPDTIPDMVNFWLVSSHAWWQIAKLGGCADNLDKPRGYNKKSLKKIDSAGQGSPVQPPDCTARHMGKVTSSHQTAATKKGSRQPCFNIVIEKVGGPSQNSKKPKATNQN